jgi:hypothetical protein
MFIILRNLRVRSVLHPAKTVEEVINLASVARLQVEHRDMTVVFNDGTTTKYVMDSNDSAAQVIREIRESKVAHVIAVE